MLLVPYRSHTPVDFVFLYVLQQEDSCAAAVLPLSHGLGAPAKLIFLHAQEQHDVQQQQLSCLCTIALRHLPSFFSLNAFS